MVKFRRYPRGYFLRKFTNRFRRKRFAYAYNLQPKAKKQKALPFRYVFLLSFVFFLLSTSIGLWMVDKIIKPPLIAHARSESTNLATYVINEAVKEEIGAGLNLNEIINVAPTGVGDSTYTAINTEIIMDVTNRITSNILRNINAVEDGETISTRMNQEGELEEITPVPDGHGLRFTVPFGRITNNVLLAHLGPDIPVEFRAIGHIQYDYRVETRNHQINSTWYEIYLDLKVGIQMLVPFNSEIVIIPQNILLASGEIKGEVPQFYSSDGKLMPSIRVPIDENTNE